MFKHLFRAIHRMLAPNSRNLLRTWLVLDERDRAPEPIVAFRESCVLVIAPHSDDEVIGCGGVIARHARNGAEVHVAFMTDGRWGSAALLSPKIDREELSTRQSLLIEQRKEEARNAAKLLGTHAIHFFDFPDRGLKVEAETVERLAGLLDKVRPQIIYLPFVYDIHEDHWKTNCVFAAAASKLNGLWLESMLVRGYEVWTPLPANRVADISDLMPLKTKALSGFTTQLQDQDYLRAIAGLNAYRAIGAFAGKGYAEAFREMPLAAYLRLIRVVTSSGRPRASEIGQR